MTVTIQDATIDDAPAISEIQIAGVRAAYRQHLPDHLAPLVLDPSDRGMRAGKWEGWMKLSRVSTIVARVDGTVTGFATLHPAPDDGSKTGEIVAVYVLPSHWRRGIGRLLCERMMAEARARGFEEIVLWVLERNDRARRFYEKLGFHPDGEKRIFLESRDQPLYELRYRRATDAFVD